MNFLLCLNHKHLCFSYQKRAFEFLHLFFPILTLLKKRGWKINKKLCKKTCEWKGFDVQIEQIDLQDLISHRFHTRLINFNVKWNLMWWCITGEKWYFVCKNNSDLLWKKNVLVIERNFWNWSLTAKNFAKILRSLEQYLFEKWKVRTIFETECFSYLLISGGFSDLIH